MDFFEEEIIAFFNLLNKHEVKYVLVGGLAVNYHGFSRSTGDVDLWLEDSPVNRQKLVNGLKEREIEGCEAFLTYPLLAGFAEILLDNGIYIDLMSNLKSFSQDRFTECYQLADDFEIIPGVKIKVMHINKLIEEKEKSNREKDIEDAKQLKRLHKK